MSSLTMSLLGKRYRRNRWQSKFAAATEILYDIYGCPSLGNYKNPVREILYIILSAQTNEDRYQEANRRLWLHFQSLGAIAKAKEQLIENQVTGAGLGRVRAKLIRLTAVKLIEDWGSNPASAIRKMDAPGAFTYLCSLPGIGEKSALCVLMYSLGFDVFPVDANIHRIVSRMGAVTRNIRTVKAQRLIPRLVPDGVSRRLHVGMVMLGRDKCRPRKPLCGGCPLVEFCRTGVRLTKKTR